MMSELAFLSEDGSESRRTCLRRRNRFPKPQNHHEKSNDGFGKITHGSLNSAKEDRNPNEDSWRLS